MSDSNEDSAPRSGRCAIVGRPNAGKSTLLNHLLGQKLVIATSKPGTTRSSVLAVYASDDPPTQIAFVDTPGLHRPKSALGKVLREEAQLGLEGADVVLLVAELPRPTKDDPRPPVLGPDDEAVLALAKSQNAKVVLALNKVDRLKNKAALLPVLQELGKRDDFDTVVPISALRGVNLDALVKVLREHLPEGLLYDDEFLTDRSERFFAAELIREAVMQKTAQEVPHGVAVLIDRFVDEGRRVIIDATIIVEKDSHKGIVIGAGGAKIKEIGIASRESIEAFLEKRAHLTLFVRVEKGWTSDPRKARTLATEIEGS
jgi:GTPase